MNRSLVLGILLLALLGAGCITSGGTDDGTIGIIVSIPPYVEWAERVGGAYVSVTPVVPAGASPHTYEITPGQMVTISDAAMWIKNGVGLEHWADKIVSANKSLVIVDISEGVDLIPLYDDADDGHGGVGAYDAHIWLSLTVAQDGVYRIADALMTLDPAHADEYAANRDAYLAELEALDATITARLESMQGRHFLVFHPAWSYFARDYGLVQLSIEKDGKEPGPEHMRSIIDQARDLGITVVFIEPQYSPDDARTIATAIGGSVVALNPLSEDYLAGMDAVADALSEGLA